MVSQPYIYQRHELAEPDWRRFPGWAGVSAAEWESAQWQRVHCVKNARQLRQVTGPGLDERFFSDLERDQRERATMSMLIPPQMLNTMVSAVAPDEPGFTEAFYADPVRRYMIPAFSDRRTDWPSHPYAQRDSLHEAEMWAVEGLTHRYPTKVLAEVLPTCPQYCGHCTRMDLVGNPTPLVAKHKFAAPREDRLAAMITYLKATPEVRDVVVSGGDVANLPWPRLEAFVGALLDTDNVRDIRLATKALMGLPQHWLSDEVRAGMPRVREDLARLVHLRLPDGADARAEEIQVRRFHRWGDWISYHAVSNWVRGREGRVFHLGGRRGEAFEPVTILEIEPPFRLARRIDARRIEPAGPGRWRLTDVVETVYEETEEPGGSIVERRREVSVEEFPETPEDFQLASGRPRQLGWRWILHCR